jgi:hypothetical protein
VDPHGVGFGPPRRGCGRRRKEEGDGKR